MGCITKKDGLSIISTQIVTHTLPQGAAAGSQGDDIGGTLDLGLIPAVGPHLSKRDLTKTSLVERGNTRQNIWMKR